MCAVHAVEMVGMFKCCICGCARGCMLFVNTCKCQLYVGNFSVFNVPLNKAIFQNTLSIIISDNEEMAVLLQLHCTFPIEIKQPIQWFVLQQSGDPNTAVLSLWHVTHCCPCSLAQIIPL
jgi:hypothetical protein